MKTLGWKYSIFQRKKRLRRYILWRKALGVNLFKLNYYQTPSYYLLKILFSFQLLMNFCSLVNGFGDVAYNARRNILGVISLEEKSTYKLIDIGFSAQKNSYMVNLLKKSKWQGKKKLI